MATHSSIHAWETSWTEKQATIHGVTRESDTAWQLKQQDGSLTMQWGDDIYKTIANHPVPPMTDHEAESSEYKSIFK